MIKICKYDLGKYCNITKPIIPVTGLLKNILDIQFQRERAVLWGEVDTSVPGTSQFYVDVRGTGEERPQDPNFKYIKTLQGEDELAYHFYVWNPMKGFDI